MSALSGGELLPLALGFIVVAAFLLLSYWHKLDASGNPASPARCPVWPPI
ncbi:Uncharacterised protein [Chromobacterium violaceum]|uniref:Uncharacterized protein n=1 Tax=Chromobacterium violaceum TaxID=536 RepID=A0A3S4HLY8_CHRVL|nr:Uncharacterised protein [Chromobacterium violaceum]